MPYDFAERLFDATAMGMRVIVAPSDVAPVAIAHPVLFQPKPGAAALAASRTAEAQAAASKAAQARVAAGTAAREATQAMLTYSGAVTLYLAYLGFAGGLSGVLLWPAVALHAVLTVLLGRARRATDVR